MLNSGYQLDGTNDFASRFYRVMSDSMGIPRDSKVEEFEIEDDLPEEETNTEGGENAEGSFNEAENFGGMNMEDMQMNMGDMQMNMGGADAEEKDL